MLFTPTAIGNMSRLTAEFCVSKRSEQISSPGKASGDASSSVLGTQQTMKAYKTRKD